MIYNYPILGIALAVLAAACLAVVAFILVSSIRIESSMSRRVRDFTDEKQQSAFDRYGTSFANKVNLPHGTTDSIETALKWAQLGGHYQGWTVGGLILRSLLFAAAGLIYVTLAQMAPMFYVGVFAAAAYPIVRVTSRADAVKKSVSRLLPEVATVIAAEMDAGGTADQALSRAAGIPGPVGEILAQAVAKTRQASRPMFSRGSVKGVLLDELQVWNVSSLQRFASQIDRVAGKGVEGPRIMTEISRGFAREYKSQVTQAAASLDNQLMFPMMIFFFAPFMIALMAPLIVQLMGAL
jgi:Flp pilus assembly protein TadB